jgi:hypothetical protein
MQNNESINNKLSTDELLSLLHNLNGKNVKSANVKLENSKETWKRIANKDSFEELGLSGSELDNFLTDWIKDNPYQDL